LFVTQDRKPDWYRQEHGLNVGPRPELIEEMHREAGVRLHLVSLDTLLNQAPTYLGAKVSANTVEEAKRLPSSPQTTRHGEALDFEIRGIKILGNKGWFVDTFPAFDAAVPFDAGFGFGEQPDTTGSHIVFDFKYVQSEHGWSRVRNRINCLLTQHDGLIVVVFPTEQKIPAGAFPAMEGIFRCAGGEFPRLQIISIDQLEAGDYLLPEDRIFRTITIN
jgi:hypothetical protein